MFFYLWNVSKCAPFIWINLLEKVFDYDYLLLDLDFNILYHFQQPVLSSS